MYSNGFFIYSQIADSIDYKKGDTVKLDYGELSIIARFCRVIDVSDRKLNSFYINYSELLDYFHKETLECELDEIILEIQESVLCNPSIIES